MPQLISSLTIGRLIPIVQNVIYALPSKRVVLFSDATTPTFQQSSDSAFATNVAITLTNGQAELAGGFIRCTSASPGNVLLKE